MNDGQRAAATERFNEARADRGWARASIDISPEMVSVKAKIVVYSQQPGSCSCHTFHSLLGLVGSPLRLQPLNRDPPSNPSRSLVDRAMRRRLLGFESPDLDTLRGPGIDSCRCDTKATAYIFYAFHAIHQTRLQRTS